LNGGKHMISSLIEAERQASGNAEVAFDNLQKAKRGAKNWATPRREYIAQKLRSLKYDPDVCRV
jgi:hypothetical protein